jgi:hypothetical protein
MLAKNKMIDKPNQNNQVNSSPSGGSASAAVTTPMAIDSPPRTPVIQAKATITIPPYYRLSDASSFILRAIRIIMKDQRIGLKFRGMIA